MVSILKKAVFLFFALMLMATVSYASKRGPECGGGGNSISIGKNFYLLDLFNFPDYKKVTLATNATHVSLSKLSPFADVQVVSGLAEEILNNWGFALALEPNIANKIKTSEAADSKLFKYANQQVPMSSFYWPQYAPKGKDVYQAAYFDSALDQITVSRVIWSLMDNVNKLGLVLHEQLRRFQMLSGARFDDNVLQNLTLMLLVCTPNKELGLDLNEMLRLGLRVDPSLLKSYYSNCLK